MSASRMSWIAIYAHDDKSSFKRPDAVGFVCRAILSRYCHFHVMRQRAAAKPFLINSLRPVYTRGACRMLA